MRSKFSYVFLSLLLWGCAVLGRDFPTAPVREIQPNVTTKTDIFKFFGEPVERGLDTGDETWTYYQYTVGSGAGQKRLHIVFNKDGTVRSYSFSSK